MRWYKLSKTTLRVFHGSPVRDIKVLKEGPGGEWQRVAGIYFSTTRSEAEKYTKVDGIPHPDNVIEAIVTFRNPADRSVLDELGYGLNGLEMRDKLREKGYDGVIDDLMNEVVAFSPDQIQII